MPQNVLKGIKLIMFYWRKLPPNYIVKNGLVQPQLPNPLNKMVKRIRELGQLSYKALFTPQVKQGNTKEKNTNERNRGAQTKETTKF